MMDGDSGRPGLTFAALVRRARQAGWMTQEELAAKSGLSPRTIQAIERGQVGRPHRESVRLLADALGLRGMGRTEFELTARAGARGAPDDRVHLCPPLVDMARCMAHRIDKSGVNVDLTGLGAVADAAVLFARLLRALGVGEGYGTTGSLVSDQTLPVQVLPGA